MIFGLSKWVVAWTIALAVRSGSDDLKMPEPTKTPSAPSCITSAASAGVAIPPAQKSTHRQPPTGGHVAHQIERRSQVLCRCGELGLFHGSEPAQLPRDRAEVPHSLHDVAGPPG